MDTASSRLQIYKASDKIDIHQFIKNHANQKNAAAAKGHLFISLHFIASTQSSVNEHVGALLQWKPEQADKPLEPILKNLQTVAVQSFIPVTRELLDVLFILLSGKAKVAPPEQVYVKLFFLALKHVCLFLTCLVYQFWNTFLVAMHN